MTMLKIGEHTVKVDDSFLNLSPADQESFVDEIIDSMNSQQPQPAQEPVRQGNILPLSYDPNQDKLSFDPNAGLLGDIIKGIRAPGRALTGKIPSYGPNGNISTQMIDEAQGLAGLAPAAGIISTARKAMPAAVKTATQQVDEATEFGVDLSRGQATKDFKDQVFEEEALHGVRGPGAQMKMAQQREKQGNQVDDAISRTRDEIAPGSSDDAFEMAENVGGAVKKRADDLKAEGNRLYDQAELQGGRVQRGGAFKDLQNRMLARLGQEGAMDGKKVAKIYPSTALQMKKLKSLANEFKKNPNKSVDWRRFENVRKSIMRAGGSDDDKRLLGVMKRELDNWIKESVDAGLISGEPEFLDSLLRARSVWADYMKIKKSDTSIIRDMASGQATSAHISNWLYGASKVGARADSANVAKEIKSILGANHPAIGELRRGVMTRLFENANTGSNKGNVALANDIHALFRGKGRDLAKELYGSASADKMIRFANMLKSLQPDPKATNPPKSGFTMGRKAQEILRQAAPIIGYSVGDITGMIGGLLFSPAANARSSRRASKMIEKPLPKAPKLDNPGTDAIIPSMGIFFGNQRPNVDAKTNRSLLPNEA